MKSKTKKKKRVKTIKPKPGLDRLKTRGKKRALENPVPEEKLEDFEEESMTCFDLMKTSHRFG